jgi:hypothetical protein
MQFGLFYEWPNPTLRQWKTLFEEGVEQIQYSEALGSAAPREIWPCDVVPHPALPLAGEGSGRSEMAAHGTWSRAPQRISH